MTLKEYCKENHISARSISQACNIPYSTVNDLLNAKTELERTSFGVVCKMADHLNLTLDVFRAMFEENAVQYSPQIIVRNKRYQLLMDGKRVDLCKVSALNTKNIEDIAAWTLRDLQVRQQVEKQNVRIIDKINNAADRVYVDSEGNLSTVDCVSQGMSAT